MKTPGYLNPDSLEVDKRRIIDVETETRPVHTRVVHTFRRLKCTFYWVRLFVTFCMQPQKRKGVVHKFKVKHVHNKKHPSKFINWSEKIQGNTCVYLNCCSTSLTDTPQSSHTKEARANSGWTGWVRTTWPRTCTRQPILSAVSSRTWNKRRYAHLSAKVLRLQRTLWIWWQTLTIKTQS